MIVARVNDVIFALSTCFAFRSFYYSCASYDEHVLQTCRYLTRSKKKTCPASQTVVGCLLPFSQNTARIAVRQNYRTLKSRTDSNFVVSLASDLVMGRRMALSFISALLVVSLLIQPSPAHAEVPAGAMHLQGFCLSQTCWQAASHATLSRSYLPLVPPLGRHATT